MVPTDLPVFVSTTDNELVGPPYCVMYPRWVAESTTMSPGWVAE
jgi:hypothetical protein